MSLILPDMSKNNAIVCCKGREQYVLVKIKPEGLKVALKGSVSKVVAA